MRTRREFLVTAGRLGLGVAGIGAMLRPSLEALAADAPRTIYLEAREVKWELAPGKTIKAMGYNGEVPGPTIRAREGERLRIALKNALSEPTTIHWHGVDVPNAMDGVPGVTQRAVQPGETFTYEFEARPVGTRWYHTHFDEHRQMDLGLAAPLIIDPKAPEPLSYDREVTLVLDDWATGTRTPVPDTDAGTAGGRGRAGGMMGGMMRGGGMGLKTVEKPMSSEEGLLRTYVDRFNAHDIEAVMDCFDDDAIVIDHEGRRFEGRDAIHGFYEWQFRVIPDGRCELRHIVSQPGSGMAETRFISTVSQTGRRLKLSDPKSRHSLGTRSRSFATTIGSPLSKSAKPSDAPPRAVESASGRSEGRAMFCATS